MLSVIDSSDLEQLTQETLRRIAVGEIDGVDVAKAIRDGDSLDVEDDMTLDYRTVDFADIGGDEVRIIHGGYYAGFLGGDLTYDAYRIGHRWYIRAVDMVGNVDWFDEFDHAEADAQFRSWTQHWIEQQFLPVPTELSGIYRDEPWFIRALTDQLARDGMIPAADMLSDYAATDNGDESAALMHWRASVLTVPPDDPPRAGTFDDTDTFVEWLDSHTLRWTDTGCQIDTESALRLRMICCFLARV